MGELLRRVYFADVLCCPHCKGRRRVLAFITDRDSSVTLGTQANGLLLTVQR